MLRVYGGKSITVLGTVLVNVQTSNMDQPKLFELYIVEGQGPRLMGRNWLKHIHLDWKGMFQVHRCERLEHILADKAELFSEELGTLRGMTAKITVDPQATPRFFRPRKVPYALREKVEEALFKLQESGVITPVQFSDWAAPIVPVLKPDGTIRICGDYKLTVNRASKVDTYPLPEIEDLLAQLAGEKLFSKLDMSRAYQQLVLDDASRSYVTINTHRGLFRYNRLPFGVASAPGVSQRTKESILQGIPGVVVYLDDILVTGGSWEEHLTRLETVLEKLHMSGLHLRKDKCEFMMPAVTYLGYKIDSEGIHTTEENVQAILQAHRPQGTTELKAYLGMLTYYNKFLKNRATVLAPCTAY